MADLTDHDRYRHRSGIVYDVVETRDGAVVLGVDFEMPGGSVEREHHVYERAELRQMIDNGDLEPVETDE